jgi:hypothetical protein
MTYMHIMWPIGVHPWDEKGERSSSSIPQLTFLEAMITLCVSPYFEDCHTKLEYCETLVSDELLWTYWVWGSHNSDYGQNYLLGCNTSSSSSLIFQRNVFPHYSGPTRSQTSYQQETGSCQIYSLTLKMEAVCCSEMLMNIYSTAPHYILEDSTLYCQLSD